MVAKVLLSRTCAPTCKERVPAVKSGQAGSHTTDQQRPFALVSAKTPPDSPMIPKRRAQARFSSAAL